MSRSKPFQAFWASASARIIGIGILAMIFLPQLSCASGFTANPFAFSNTTIDVGQTSVANTIFSGGSGGPYSGEWTWLLGNGVNETVNWGAGNTISISSQPKYLSYSPSGNLLYVISTSTFYTINAFSNVTLSSTSAGGDPYSPPAINPQGTLAYYTCCQYTSTNAIKVMNLQTVSIINSISFPTTLQDAILNPQGTYLYVTNSVAAVYIVNTMTNTVTGSISLPTTSTAMAINPSGTLLYVGLQGSYGIEVYNTVTLSQVNTIATAIPSALVFNPQGTLLYSAYSSGGTINVINTATNTIVNTISGLYTPGYVTFNPSGALAYAGQTTGSGISAIDVVTNTLLSGVSVFGNNYDGAVDPTGLPLTIASYTGDEEVTIPPPESQIQSLPNGLLQIAINAVSGNTIIFTFNGASYTESTGASKTIYGNWVLFGFAQDTSNAVYVYGSNSLLFSNTIKINPKLIAVNVLASNVTIGEGQAETLTASWTGGTAPYTVNVMVTNSANGNVLASNIVTGISSNSESFNIVLPNSQNSLGSPQVTLKVTDSASSPATNTATFNPITQVKAFAPALNLSLCYAYKYNGEYYLSQASRCNAIGYIGSMNDQLVGNLYVNNVLEANSIQYSSNSASYSMNLQPGIYTITFNTLGNGNYVYGGVTDLLNIINSSDLMGINGGPYWWGYTTYDYNLMYASGVKYIRMDILAPPYSAFQQQLANMTSNGFKIIGILDYDTLCGAHQNDSCGTWTLAQWNATVVNAINAYPDVHIWEIWNEPQYGYAQSGYLTNGLAYNYSRMVESAAPLIKAHNATDTVICFGGDNIYSGGDTYSAAFYNWAAQVWSNLTAASAVSDCSAISLHAYTNYYGWELNQTAGGSYTVANAVFNQSLSAYETLTGKPIWITEYGMPYDNSCRSEPCNYTSQYDYDMQAAALFLTHNYVRAVTVFNLASPSWAIVNVSTESPFPAFYGYRNLSEMVANVNTLGYSSPSLSSGAPAMQTMDQGQSVTITGGSMSGGTAPYTYQWYAKMGSTPTLNPANAANADVYLGTGTTSGYAESNNALFSTNSLTTTGTYYFVLNATDMYPTSLSSSAFGVVLNTQLYANAITPSNPGITSGLSVTLQSNPAGGTPPYTYQWYTGSSCNSLISGATSSTYLASPSSTTTYSYKVTDSATFGESACSAGDSVTVYATNQIFANAISPSNPIVNTGQSVELFSNATGGIYPYTYQWYDGSSATCALDSAISGATSSTYNATPISSSYYCYKVTDSQSTPASNYSSTVFVVVTSGLSSNGIGITNTVVTIHNTTYASTAISGGAGSLYTGQWSWIGPDNGGNQILDNKVINTISAGSGPAWIAFSPSGSTMYVTDFNNAYVSVINTATNTIVNTINTGGSQALGIVLNPAGTLAYVPIYSPDATSTVNVINTALDVVVNTINVGGYLEPTGVAMSPSGGLLYVTNSHSGSTTVSVINTAANALVNSINVGSEPFGITINSKGTLLYVANSNANTVSVISTATNTVINTITVGPDPYGVAFNPQGTLAYAAMVNGGTVNVIEVATNSVIATIQVGSQPRFVTFNPSGALAYVANYGSGTVSVIDTATSTVIGTISVGSGPNGIAFSPNGLLYVTNENSGTASVISNVPETNVQSLPLSVLALSVNAVSSNTLTFTFNGVTYTETTGASNTVYGRWYVYGLASDSEGNTISMQTNFTVEPGAPLSVVLGSSPALPGTVTGGNVITFIAQAAGGSWVYSTYNFIVFNQGTGLQVANLLTTSSSFSYTLPVSLIGDTLYANVIVTDTNHNTANSVHTGALTVAQSSEGSGGSSGGTGGGGSSGGSPGSGGGGQFLPSVMPFKTANQSGYRIVNFTQDNQEKVGINGTIFTIIENFITPTTAGVTIDGISYTLSNGQIAPLSGHPGYFVQLVNISYLPIIDLIKLNLFAEGNYTLTTVPSQANSTSPGYNTSATGNTTSGNTGGGGQPNGTANSSKVASGAANQGGVPLWENHDFLVAIIAILIVGLVYFYYRRRKEKWIDDIIAKAEKEGEGEKKEDTSSLPQQEDGGLPMTPEK